MTRRDMTKKIVGLVAKYGSGTIIYSIIRNNVNDDRADLKIGVGVASFALGGAVGEVAAKQTDRMIDEIFDAFNGSAS